MKEIDDINKLIKGELLITVFKSDLVYLNDEEFKLLYEHLDFTEYQMKVHNYDTIKIGNVVFKKN